MTITSRQRRLPSFLQNVSTSSPPPPCSVLPDIEFICRKNVKERLKNCFLGTRRAMVYLNERINHLSNKYGLNSQYFNPETIQFLNLDLEFWTYFHKSETAPLIPEPWFQTNLRSWFIILYWCIDTIYLKYTHNLQLLCTVWGVQKFFLFYLFVKLDFCFKMCLMKLINMLLFIGKIQ